MANENINRLSTLNGKKVRLIVDEGNELICIPQCWTEADDDESAYLVKNIGGKDTDEYGELPFFTNDEIKSIEIMA